MDNFKTGVLYLIYGLTVILGLIIEFFTGVALCIAKASTGHFSLEGFYEAEYTLGFVTGFKQLIKGEL